MFAMCGGPEGRGKSYKSKLRTLLGDDPYESAWQEQFSLINKAIFQAPAPSYSKNTHPWSPADCVYLDTKEGYHFPAVLVRCKRAPAVRAVLHCHANACDIGHIYGGVSLIDELCQRDAECWQANVLLVEYPGYGASPGVSYERSVDRHVMASYLYLVEELKYKPESIVLFGRSLGSGPVCRLAMRLQAQGEKIGGVILHSPFVSVREAGISLLGGVATIITDRWDNRVPLAELKCRLLILHGVSDEVVPFVHAESLRDIRKKNNLPCSFFPYQGTHNCFSYYRDYLCPVENFLASHEKSKLPPLSDPLPLAKFSKAQVKEIVEEHRRTFRVNATTRRKSAAAKSEDASGDGGVDEDDDEGCGGADDKPSAQWKKGGGSGGGTKVSSRFVPGGAPPLGYATVSPPPVA